MTNWSLREARPDYRAPSSQLSPGTPDYPTESYLLAADRTALALRGCRDRISLPLAKVAARFAQQNGWTSFGFARLDDHARERFGRTGRWVRDLAALGEALVSLPGLDSAITGTNGGRPIGRVAALAIARVATTESLAAWIDLSRTVTVRQLKSLVREARQHGITHPINDSTQPGSAAPRAEIPDESQGDHHRVRLAVPKPVLAAFDETLALFRAVEGHESTITSFVESLLADAMAGEGPPDAEDFPVHRGPGREQIESALQRSTDRWSHLPPPPFGASALHVAGESLEQLDAIGRGAGIGGPKETDEQLRQLIALENTIDRRLGQLLTEMARHHAWVRLRFAGAGHYAEERLGMARTAAGDRVRVERALRALPLVRRAYEEGQIGLEAALLVARILGNDPTDRSTQALWIRRAIESTTKRLRDEERALRRGKLGRRDALLERLVESPDLRSPLPLDDHEWHRSLRREPGTARRRLYRFGLAALGLSVADAGGDAGDDVLSTIPTSTLEPDVFLQVRLPRDLATAFLGAIESARRRLIRQAEDSAAPDDAWDESSIQVQGVRPSLIAARMFSMRCRRTPAWAGLLALMEEFVDTWDAQDRSRRRSRDAIYIRDGWRCSAPGCSSRRNLEDHHLVYRSRGGGNDHDNRLCLCRFHHQIGEHGGLASCRGEAPLGVVWRLGRVPLASWFRNERRLGERRPGVSA